MSHDPAFIVAPRSPALVAAFQWPRVTTCVAAHSPAAMAAPAAPVNGTLYLREGTTLLGILRGDAPPLRSDAAASHVFCVRYQACAHGSSKRARTSVEVPHAMPCATTGDLFVCDTRGWKYLCASQVARCMGWSEPTIRVLCDAAAAGGVSDCALRSPPRRRARRGTSSQPCATYCAPRSVGRVVCASVISWQRQLRVRCAHPLVRSRRRCARRCPRCACWSCGARCWSLMCPRRGWQRKADLVDALLHAHDARARAGGGVCGGAGGARAPHYRRRASCLG